MAVNPHISSRKNLSRIPSHGHWWTKQRWWRGKVMKNKNKWTWIHWMQIIQVCSPIDMHFSLWLRLQTVQICHLGQGLALQVSALAPCLEAVSDVGSSPALVFCCTSSLLLSLPSFLSSLQLSYINEGKMPRKMSLKNIKTCHSFSWIIVYQNKPCY